MVKEQLLPKWLITDGYTLYQKGEVVTNIFSGESYELNAVELSMYDFIMGTQHLLEIAPHVMNKRRLAQFRKGLKWFRRNNADAYMVLLN